jgi:uncharacterized protein (TIGR03437 family)
MSKLLSLLLLIPFCLSGQQYRAFWADAFHDGYKTPAQVDRLVEDLKQAKANAIFYEARVRSNSYYRQSLEPFAEDASVPAGFDPLEYLILKAHAVGIEVHAWYVVYPLWRTGAAPVNPEHLYHKHGPPASGEDRWLNQSAAGVETLALDPGHPGVLPYLMDVFLDPVRRYDIDGVHLDYVRYPEDADYGYNPHSIERFNRQSGRVGRPVTREAAWSQWRRDQVTALVRQLYLRLQQVRPSAKLSAATVTWGNGPLTDAEYRGKDAYGYVFQDWRGWLEEGILDFSMPMNYFAEPRYAAYLTRWAEYQKNRQYGRGYINGLGNYLNTVPDTLAQLDRVLSPSAEGKTPLGVSFYSYSATRSDDPAQKPNADFYKTIGEYFREPAAAPELPWKTRPEKGHLMGRVEIRGGEMWWTDGLTAKLTARGGGEWQRRTDVSGFFGWVDLLPGEYRVTLESNGQQVHVSEWMTVEAGKVAETPLQLDGSLIDATLPLLFAGGLSKAAPGGVVRLSGRNLAAGYAAAGAVPLPQILAGSVVVVNGELAPLFELGADRVTIQMPFTRADGWEIKVRRAGTESRPLRLEYAEALPEILEVRRGGDGILEILATGLGRTMPPAPPGTGASEAEPLPRTELPVKVLLATATGEAEADPEFAGLAPWVPGQYLVRVKLPESAGTGELRLRVGGAVSGAKAY